MADDPSPGGDDRIVIAGFSPITDWSLVDMLRLRREIDAGYVGRHRAVALRRLDALIAIRSN